MKISLQTNQLSYKASARDLGFINNIRDREVPLLASLQKQKIETLLKFREVKKVIAEYENTLSNYSNVSAEIVNRTKRDLGDLNVFLETLRSKLHEINLSIIAEEEKNY